MLWTEHRAGPAAYLADMEQARNEGEWRLEGPVYDPMPIFPGRVIYDKGAWILHMLRGRIGDAAFFALLEEWGSGGGRPGGTVITEEFIALASSLAGEDLNGFFWPYLTSTELPRVNAQLQVETGDAGPATRLRVTLSQHQEPLFDNVYPVVVTTSGGEQTVKVRLAGALDSAVFEFASPISEARLDPDGWVLWSPFGDDAISEGLQSVYPNPSAGDDVVLRYWLNATKPGTLTFYDVRGLKVAARAVPAGPPGLNEIKWDAQADDGARLPSGVYWAALDLDGRRSVQKFAVVR
jgi:hypothetical protein